MVQMGLIRKPRFLNTLDPCLNWFSVLFLSDIDYNEGPKLVTRERQKRVPYKGKQGENDGNILKIRKLTGCPKKVIKKLLNQPVTRQFFLCKAQVGNGRVQ